MSPSSSLGRTCSSSARYEDAASSDTARFGALFRHLLAEGIYLPPSQFECLFPSLAHTDEHVDLTVAAALELAA